MEKQNIVEIHGKNLPISTKHSIEIAKFIRNKNVNNAMEMLNKVIEKKTAVPFGRFNRDVGHKPGKVGPGRYPQKASKTIINLLESLIANAQNKGMDINSLSIQKIIANRASTPYRSGRRRRIKARGTHIDIIAIEKNIEKKKPEAKKK